MNPERLAMLAPKTVRLEGVENTELSSYLFEVTQGFG